MLASDKVQIKIRKYIFMNCNDISSNFRQKIIFYSAPYDYTFRLIVEFMKYNNFSPPLHIIIYSNYHYF